jgi:hypothetical protein
MKLKLADYASIAEIIGANDPLLATEKKLPAFGFRRLR